MSIITLMDHPEKRLNVRAHKSIRFSDGVLKIDFSKRSISDTSDLKRDASAD